MAFRTRSVDLGCVVACASWVVTFLLIAGGAIDGYVESRVTVTLITLVSFGLAMSAASATATIRTYFDRMDRKMDQFFQLGADYGSGVRKMR